MPECSEQTVHSSGNWKQRGKKIDRYIMDCYTAVRMNEVCLLYTANMGRCTTDGRGLHMVCRFYEVKNGQRYIV